MPHLNGPAAPLTRRGATLLLYLLAAPLVCCFPAATLLWNSEDTADLNPLGAEPPEQEALTQALIHQERWLLAAVVLAWLAGLLLLARWPSRRSGLAAGLLLAALIAAGIAGVLVLDAQHERFYNPVRGEPIVTVPPGQSVDRYPLPGELTAPYPLLGQAVVVWGWSDRPVAARFVDAEPGVPAPAPGYDLLVVRFAIELSGEVPARSNLYYFWAKLPHGPDEAYLGQLLATPPATPPPHGEMVELEVAFEVPRGAQQILVRDNVGWPFMEWSLFRPATAASL